MAMARNTNNIYYTSIAKWISVRDDDFATREKMRKTNERKNDRKQNYAFVLAESRRSAADLV